MCIWKAYFTKSTLFLFNIICKMEGRRCRNKMKNLLYLLLLFCSINSFPQTTTQTYTPDNSNFPNPERGFYRYTDTYGDNVQPLTVLQLNQIRNTTQQSLIFRYFVLNTFTGSPISNSFLTSIHNDFNIIRQAGFKVIPRFTYVNEIINYDSFDNPIPPFGDAPKNIVLQHIAQLKPIFQQHADVILTLQNGFWGTWGENYYSDYFGSEGNAPLTAQNWADRKVVTDSLLNAIPSYRTVSLRYPELKATYYNLSLPGDSITLNQAFNGTTLSRLAAHNDCFLVAYNDYTFADTLSEKPYWASESRYLVMGGETCGDTPTYTNCSNTLDEMERFHWTYCNDYYHPDVIDRWENENCLENIKRRLGYRFQLLSSTAPVTVASEGTLSLSFQVQNTGFAAPVNPRALKLILRNQNDNSEYAFDIPDINPQYWFANTTQTVFTNIPLPATIPCGEYDLFLHLPDPITSLSANPHYAIRLANTGLWESNTGYNALQQTIEVVLPVVINGAATVCANLTQTYTVNAIPGSTYNWTISGGTILSGQGTNQIEVQWQNGITGTIQVIVEKP